MTNNPFKNLRELDDELKITITGIMIAIYVASLFGVMGCGFILMSYLREWL